MRTAKDRLTNKDKFTILTMIKKDKELVDICKKTGKSEEAIIAYLAETSTKTKKANDTQEVSENNKVETKQLPSRFKRLMGGDGKRGVSVMTGAAALISDEAGKNARALRPKYGTRYAKDGDIHVIDTTKE